MFIEIESYKGDTKLYGKKISKSELKKQFDNIQNLYDENSDSFIDLFCRMYGWVVVQNDNPPKYIYDRDTMLLRVINYGQKYN